MIFMKTSIKLQPKRSLRIFIYSVVVFALLKPDSLAYIGLAWLDSLLILIDIFILLFVILQLIMQRYKMSGVTVCIILLYSAMTLSTVIVSKDYFTLLKTAGPAIAMCMFTDFAMQRHPMEYLKSSLKLLCILYTLNFITIILYYPTGMYQTDYVVGDTYLMGFDNGMIYNLLPMCCYAYICSYVLNNKIFTKQSIYATVLMLISEIYVKSGTGIIQSVLMILFVICINKGWLKNFLNPGIVFITFYFGTYLLTIFRIQNYMANFIGFLGKDLTLTGRTYLWDYAIAVFKQHPIIGIGASGRTVLGINGHYYPHPHCMILDFLYKGGIVMFVFFVLLTVVFICKYKQMKSEYLKKIILITLFIFMIGEMVNSMQYKIFFWGIFVLIGYIDNLESIREENIIKKIGQLNDE